VKLEKHFTIPNFTIFAAEKRGKVGNVKFLKIFTWM
jgi:hypothetical protein